MSDTQAPLAGRHAIVTGAGRGIGAAIARRLAADGARLTLLGRQLEPLQALAAELGEGGTRTLALACDVADAASVARAIGHATEAAGTAHVLVNNAGQATSAPLVRTSDELWQQMLAVNLTGTFLVTRAVLPGMLAAGWGRVVNVASTAGQRGYAYVSAYVAAKHGVIGLTRSLALEVAAKGVTVNAVCPGYTETDLLRASVGNVVAKTGRSEADARAEFARHNPQGRLVQPDEVAHAVAWLASEGAAAINGQSISVSGGEVM
jgi:NAD(P)-dependent dehydrogenase (short-subunit alcohol dehydrogenase family)